LTPPNISSKSAAGEPGQTSSATGPDSASGGLGTLVERLAETFGADTKTLSSVASTFEDVRERAPDLFVPAAATLAHAFGQIAAKGGGDPGALLPALGEWAIDAAGEPIERLRRDCQRFQSAMTRGVLRLYYEDKEGCAERLHALQRFIFLQLALLASLSVRGQEDRGVTRTLPTPEYAAFMEILRTTLESHRQQGRKLGLLLLQVGKVEQVDRLLGLQRGEAFMLRITRRMREGILRKQDQLGRVSRDQFACLLPRIAGEGVGILAANKILGALEPPVPIGERSFAADAVIGIAMFPDHGTDPQTLVRNAKLAARAARDATERVVVYDPAHGESEERTQLYEARLRRSLEENELKLVYEPQLDLRTGGIAGLDCMLCWTDSELGEVPEALALEAAETSGLSREITWWIFNNALRQHAELGRAGLDVPIRLKVTASGLAQLDFPEFVDRALRTWGVSPKRLIIAIDETALAGAIEPVREALSRLKALGLRLGIEGFGTGSSSLIGLAQLPLDEMKLGATFVEEMRQPTFHAKLVRSLVQLAHNLGFRVTAEGVKDAETAQALSSLGCEQIQGAYVSRPLEAGEVLAFGAQLTGSTRVAL
jgi:predicted signal transduction protein with EAL and GGDEF domain